MALMTLPAPTPVRLRPRQEHWLPVLVLAIIASTVIWVTFLAWAAVQGIGYAMPFLVWLLGLSR